MVYLVLLVGVALWLLGFSILSQSSAYSALGLGLMVTGAIYQGACFVAAQIKAAQAPVAGAQTGEDVGADPGP